MKPGCLNYFLKTKQSIYFGEIDDDNKRNGRGMVITSHGNIEIEYWNKGKSTSGNYINTYFAGEFAVGEKSIHQRQMLNKGIWYSSDGTQEKFDY